MTGPAPDGRRRRWVAVDVEFFCGSRQEQALYDRWGSCGVMLWVAFIAACKRASSVEGRVPFQSEEQMASALGVHGRRLEDADGKPFTYAEFFAWTGHRRWTRKARGTWPAVELLGYEELNRPRRRSQPRSDPDATLSEPRRNLAQKPRSEGRNARPDRTGQDRTR
jgi:hypothetical protein